MSDSNGNGNESARVGTSTVKQGLAQMLKGGVIVSVFLLGLIFNILCRCSFSCVIRGSA